MKRSLTQMAAHPWQIINVYTAKNEKKVVHLSLLLFFDLM
jgi:hypothetical protein